VSGQQIRIIAEVTAKTGAGDELWKYLATLVDPTRNEAGNISYDIHRDLEDPDHFLFYETWASRSHFEAHLKSKHIAAYERASENLIRVPVRVTVCELLTSD
jgi:quinol monooxygenase YgiN